MDAQLAIDAHDVLGEGPVWDEAARRFLWTDNATGTVHAARFQQDRGWFEERQWCLHRPLGHVVPCRHGGLVVASGTEILRLDEDTGQLTTWARLPADPQQVVCNEIKCDRSGRLWVGTRAHNLSSPQGALYRIDAHGEVVTVLEGVTIANGMEWSPDDKTFYFIDSYTLAVDAFNFNLERGTLSQRHRVVSFAKGTGAPDGMTVDRQGNLWIAVAGTGEVQRYTPAGERLEGIRTSAPLVTSCALGGYDGRDFWITSAAITLPPEALTVMGFSVQESQGWVAAPGAGGVFCCRVGTGGLPSTPYAAEW
ncbi:MAG TPA: SMP-30/gluconolactonase/LRE family protein [Steroidobacteraceae bacterium]